MEKISDGFHGEKAIVTPYSIRDFQASSPLTENLFITHIGYYPNAKFHFRNRPKGAREYILIYCEDGEGWVEVDQKKFYLTQKKAFIVPAVTPHVYAADERFPWSIYWMHFRGKHIQHYAPIIGRILHTEEGAVNRHDFRVELFESIFQNLANGYLQDNLEYSSVCLQHFLASFMYTAQFNRLFLVEDVDIVYKSITFMKNNLEKKLTLEDIAGSVNYSPAYFGTLFKEKTSFSPVEYYNQLKIQHSCSLLQFANLKIKEIAFQLGYYDAFHFSKAFSQEMGISPREYRKRYKME